MDAEGLPYGERTMTYNSRLAQELGKWADTQPGGEAIHDALFRAYFVDARGVSPDRRCCSTSPQGVGLPVDQAREVLERRTFKDAVDADWDPVAPVRDHGRADVRRRALRRRRRPALRGAGAAGGEGAGRGMTFEKVLVTGGAGRLGRRVVAELAPHCAVSVLDRAQEARDGIDFPVDVMDLDALGRALRGFDAVIHLAAIDSSVTAPPEVVFDVNVRGTLAATRKPRARPASARR